MSRAAAILLTSWISLLVGILVARCDDVIAVRKIYHGESDAVAAYICGNLKVVPQRDAAGRITGYQWGNASGTFVPAVTQIWQRGVGGRIESAGSDVAGAPAFDYLIDPQAPGDSFDARGRRLKCSTAGGTWTYEYTDGGLTSASHTSLGSFSYNFDGIGRRTGKGPTGSDPNETDLLNRTLAWTHEQDKSLKIAAHPAARVWVNGVEIPDFTGQHSYAITPPDANGGWVEWEALAILENQGEGAGSPAPNPLASPDAKAEKRGAVWVPPVNESFTFDAAGNRESSAQWDYGWDAKNQLVRARTKNHDSAAQSWDLTFSYDSEGRRFKKHVVEYRNGDPVAEKDITFVWDGWDLIYERQQLPSGLTTLERKYLWGPDIANGAAGGAGGLLLIRETKGNATTDLIPLCDGTGHVVALTDSSGTLQASYAYGPFGELITASGPRAQANPWRYATKYRDEETGLYYFGHRYHDPVTGQWLSREPLGESESVNLYSYCHNDPVNKVDVLGLAEAFVGPAVVNGIPQMIFDDWAGGWWGPKAWNAFIGEKRGTPYMRSPDAGQLRRNFSFEDGCWHVRPAGERDALNKQAQIGGLPGGMEDIRPLMKAMEVGTVAITTTPFLWAGGSAVVSSGLLTEAGAGTFVYGGHLARTALANPWVAGTAKAGFSAMAAGTGYGLLTDEEFRGEYVAMEMSSPVPGEGSVLGVQGLRMLASDARAGATRAWAGIRPVAGELIEGYLYKTGSLAYAVPPTSNNASFVEWWKLSRGRVHGNSLQAQGPHDLYVIVDSDTRELLHFGETGRGFFIRFNEHVADFAKIGVNIDVLYLRTVDGKAVAKELEKRYLAAYRKLYGRWPRSNFTNH